MTAIANERLLDVKLGQHQIGQVEKAGPRGETPKQTRGYAEVAVADGAPRHWVHDVTFLSVLAIAQLAWISGLAYGVYQLA